MTTSHERLRELALVATPGEWTAVLGHSVVTIISGAKELLRTCGTQYWQEACSQDQTNAAFIAAANPQAILSLLSQLDEARAEVERLTKADRGQSLSPSDLDLAKQLAQAEARGRERALMGAIRTVADSIGYMDDATWNDACNHIIDHLRALKDNPHG